jgi:hypothetical protein
MDMQSPQGLRLALELLEGAGIAAPSAWRRLAEEVRYHRRDLNWLDAALVTWRETPPPPLNRGRQRDRWIALLAETFGQWLDVWAQFLRGPYTEFMRRREPAMVANTLAQLDRFSPDTRAALWAHNGHVSLHPGSLGSGLRLRLGTAYQTVGFAFGAGTVNAGTQQPGDPNPDWKLRPVAMAPAPAGSMEHLLDQLDLDCCAASPAEIAALQQPMPFRQMGAVLFNEGRENFAEQCVPADLFDLVVYFRKAHPSCLLVQT